MDGVSIAASVIGIAAAGAQLSIKLLNLTSQISTASDRMTSINSDIAFTSEVLRQLGELMPQKSAEDGTGIFSQIALQTVESAASTCRTAFEKLSEIIKAASRQLRRVERIGGEKIVLTRFEKMKWPFLQPNLEPLKTELGEAKRNRC